MCVNCKYCTLILLYGVRKRIKPFKPFKAFHMPGVHQEMVVNSHYIEPRTIIT